MVVITEASIRHDLKLNDAEDTLCLLNTVIFEELARMGYEKPSEKLTFYKAFFSPQWKFFIHTILQCISAKTTSWNKFSSTMASTIISGVPFYMFPRFTQIFVNLQIGDMSHHKGIYVNPSLTKKLFANMKRVGTGFFRAVTPLFGTMMVQAIEEVGELPTAVQDTPIPDALSSSQHKRKYKPRRKEIKVSPIELHIEDHVSTTSNDLLPSGEDSMQLKELMVLCTNLLNKVLNLDNEVIEMKSSHKAKIAELERKVEKLEEENRPLTKELKSFNTKVESPAIQETVVKKEESSKQRRKITDIDADAGLTWKILLMLMVKQLLKKWLSVAPTNITTAEPSEATKTTADITTAPKAKGIVFHDMEESTTRTASLKLQVKDKGKAKLVEEHKVLKSRKAQIAIDDEVARMIKAKWNANMKDNIDWNEDYSSKKEIKKEKVEKDQTAKKQKGDELEHDNIEKQNLEEQQEAEELKRNLEIVPDDEDDIFHTPLDYNASREHSQRDIKSKAFINCEIGQLALNQEKQHVFNVLNEKSFKITFLEFVELVIISTYSDPIQMLVVMSFDDLKLCDSDDSTFRVDITRRFPIDRKSIELLTFAPAVRDSPESMFVIANR
nr:hypothetical protein [Tanacetum cinerariifolium]